MIGELFDSTIPFGEPELLKASAYKRFFLEPRERESDPLNPLGAAVDSDRAQLSESLQADLVRFEHRGSTEPVELIAACIRHSSRVTIYLQCADRVVPLTLFPNEQLVHCPLPMPELIQHHLRDVRVLHIEPATLRPPGDAMRELVGETRLHHPLAPLLWALALRGPRRDLLPEIAGPAVYRVSPAFELSALPLNGAVRAAISKLRRQATPLHGLAAWPAFDRERAARLLNALYLQAGLIISRSHPAAVRDNWFGGRS
jgi:hypothetical protein